VSGFQHGTAGGRERATGGHAMLEKYDRRPGQMKLTARFLNSRRAVRAPLPFFRAGFGWMFGGRLMMLEHRGGYADFWRETILEVVERGSKDSLLVASPLGQNSQWYRNLREFPVCRVSVGFVRGRDARAELLSPEEGAAALARYASKHPTTHRALKRAIVEATGDAEPDVPMVRLTLGSRRR
jgi:deazaflavin-dependent oxidoreductase (nitroreductase family)